MKVVIYNDTSKAFGKVHFGCQLVMESLNDLLAGAGFDIIGSVSLDDALANRLDKPLLEKADLIVANGEGSYHHNRRPDFIRIANKYPTALINTVYEDNDDNLEYFKYIAARESKSRDTIAKQVPCDLVPDVIFSSRYLASIQSTQGGGCVSVQHFNGVRTLQDKANVVPAIASSDSIMTGSFHAGCVAAYYGKPLSLSASNTHKMQGLAADMGLRYMSDEAECADPDYVPIAQQRIASMIDKLKQC